jgi:enoyl-CoA hydratase/carnithine racemase
MYTALADILNDADKDDSISVVVWNGAGDSFTAGNDVKDFLENPPPPVDSPQLRLTNALINFKKPLIAAVHGGAIGGGTTMLTHFDFVYAGESTKFQLPFIDLALVPEYASSYSIPARIGYLRAAELFLLGKPFDARRAAELGLVTRVVPDSELLATANETAQTLTQKPSGALQASKRLLKRSSLEQINETVKAEGEEFTARVRSAESKEAFTAFIEKRRPDFAKAREAAVGR